MTSNLTKNAQATSFEVRAELESLLERDLLGPRDGDHEELPPGMQPAERYLVGRLVPRTRPSDPPPDAASDDEVHDPDLIDNEVTDAASEPAEDIETAKANRTGTMAASAMGLSFRVPRDVTRLVVTASWGAYAPGKSSSHLTEAGNPATTWQRTPRGGEVELDLPAHDGATLVPDHAHEAVVIRPTIREREGAWIVDLSLINDQPVPGSSPDTARLYQAGLTVRALDGQAAVFLGHNDPELSPDPIGSDDERRHLDLLYRRHREYAHGRQCAVDAEVRSGEDRAWRLATTSFPAADVPLTLPASESSMPGVVLDMSSLGSPELAGEDLVRALRPIVTGYRSWLKKQEVRLTEPEIARYEPAGSNKLAEAITIADRLDRAIDLLRDDAKAREAFRFANQAMARQRVRGEVTRQRMASPGTPLRELLDRYDVPAQRSWRPFQLAFVLLCLPGLTDPAHQDAHRDPVGQAQLLFFPTGGGKTEAYLGLTAYTLAIRRLQGIVGSGAEQRDGTEGVAVLMRYTLRLLTAQQFQRAAALICACEQLRLERIAGGDGRWGETPFRLGLWVGSKVSPNTYDEAKRAIADFRGNDEALGGPLQLASCPWCGARLAAGRDLRGDDKQRRVLLHCSDPEGECPFTPRHSKEGIPVLTSDEEVYRLTPSLVIATVDKLAQLPWKAATGALFGTVDTRCPRHGWLLPDQTYCTGTHQRTGDLAATKPQPALRLRPPDLIIQDELHLISDALGSMVGLYETVIDQLCTRTHDGVPVRPVLVASTATVRRAVDQVEQVFARGLAIFPPQVLDAGETFFSTVSTPSPETPSRRYRGICATGERFKSIEIRVAATIMEHTQFLFDRHGAAADPYMTLVDYFTSTRELAGMRRLVEDDVAERLSPASGRLRKRPMVSELTSRMPSSRIASTLADLEQPFDPATDTLDALAALRGPERDEMLARMKARQPALDVLLATSMLQVGVDVQRLGLMLVTGQPKSTAEYIQATSRVGRDRRRPGLVITLYQWSRPRDLGHYESFAYDHATFGMRVEGLTTTPYSERALDRGLSAVLAAAVRQRGPDSLENLAAGSAALDGQLADRVVALLTERAGRVTHDTDRVEEIRQQAVHRLDQWRHKRDTLPTGVLGFDKGPDVTGLLSKPESGPWHRWTAPMSLREVEPEVLLQLDQRDRSADDAPAWSYERPTS